MEIVDFPNYLIYPDGKIWNKKYEIYMAPYLNKGDNGYYQVILTNNKKIKKKYIHRLIGQYYIPNPYNYPEIDHINRIKTDNNLSNLRWANRSMQSQNRNAYSNTGQKYICELNVGKYKYYKIQKQDCFRSTLRCDNYNLDDAIMLRDSLLSMIED